MRGTTPLSIRAGLAISLTLCLSHCGGEPSALEGIRARGELRVATLAEPSLLTARGAGVLTDWAPGNGPLALERELAEQFATRLGVHVIFELVPTEAALREELRAHRVDLVAAHLAYDKRWLADALPARPYEQVAQVVVAPRGRNRPQSVAALAGRSIAVATGSPQGAVLGRLRAASPALQWRQVTSTDPLDEVAAGRAEVAIVDASEFAVARSRYPDLTVAFELAERRPAQWIVSRSAPDLQHAIDAFFADLASTNDLQELLARANQTAPRFEVGPARGVIGDIAARLPGLQPLFETASASTGVDWRLLAAIGYQESQWNPLATSPNGAGGVMMLMPDTADALGVEDRTDPGENIMAGARYFAQVHDMVPERIAEPDRTWLALAAYNVGFGHLEDARIITQRKGGNPDLWADVREHLPLLADESWYPLAKRGYARGAEPVQFVERVQGFLSVLEQRRVLPAAQALHAKREPLRTASRGEGA